MGHPVQGMGSPVGDELRAKIEGAPWLVMNAAVSRMWFLGEPVAVQRRLVKAIGENAGIPLEFKHVEEILWVAGEEGVSGKTVSLPLGWKFVVESEELSFLTPDLREPASPQDCDRDYEYELPLPGQVVVDEAGSSIEARTIPAGAELASRRPILAGPYEVPQEDQGTAAGTSCGPAGAQIVAGRGER